MVIKICGLRLPDHALAAAKAGADMLGLVFAPSKRRLTLDEAALVVKALREAPLQRRPALVGLFVNEQAELINAATVALGLAAVQLSGDESPALLGALRCPRILKSIRLDGSVREQAWVDIAGQSAARWADELGAGDPLRPAVRLLIDGHVAGAYGGTGARADWQSAAALAEQQPIMLAGGLNADNIATAIIAVRPWGIDVSSGVETDGVKDVAKIEAFIGAARGLG
jgi:phosphoribosylanthranilate isomerase